MYRVRRITKIDNGRALTTCSAGKISNTIFCFYPEPGERTGSHRYLNIRDVHRAGRIGNIKKIITVQVSGNYHNIANDFHVHEFPGRRVETGFERQVLREHNGQ